MNDVEMKNGANGTDTLYVRKDGKLIELYDTDKPDLDAGRLRMHKATCRFEGCENDWYISDRKMAWHERKKKEIPTWKTPSSCPEHRKFSLLNAIYSRNHDQCPTGKIIFANEEDAEKATELSATGDKKRAYACDKCGGFHHTSLSLKEYRELDKTIHSNPVDIPKCPKTGKRSFETEQQALEFEERNREQYGNPHQYAYACEDCPSWHLSSSPPGNNRIAQVRLPVALETSTSLTGVGHKQGIETAEVLRLRESGLTMQQIADRLHVSVATVSYHLRKDSKDVATPATVSKTGHQDLDVVEAELLRQLEEIQKKKKLMEEAKRLRVEKVNPNSIRIAKEGEAAILPMSELDQLINALTALRP